MGRLLWLLLALFLLEHGSCHSNRRKHVSDTPKTTPSLSQQGIKEDEQHDTSGNDGHDTGNNRHDASNDGHDTGDIRHDTGNDEHDNRHDTSSDEHDVNACNNEHDVNCDDDKEKATDDDIIDNSQPTTDAEVGGDKSPEEEVGGDKEAAGRDKLRKEDKGKESRDKLSKENEEAAQKLFNEGFQLIQKLNFYSKKNGYELLLRAAALGHHEAMEQVAYGYIYGSVLKRNFTKAMEIFTKLADDGDPAGQQGLGFMYATGIGVNSNQAKAILYYTFGALGGNPHSRMTMGYRSFYGVGVPQSCDVANSYYSKVASLVSEKVSVFAGGHAVQKARLVDEQESTVFAGITEDEVDHYKEVFADSGAQLSLGLYYLFGMGGVERNLPAALELLERVDTASARALIGRIYAEGSPPQIPQNNKTAIMYFKEAIQEKNSEGYTGMGIMYYKGMGVEQSYTKAMEYFHKAAERGSPEANMYLGLGYLFGNGKQLNPTKALTNLNHAAAHGGYLQAQYYLGYLYDSGLVGGRDCRKATELFKAVSERGWWARLLREAHKTYLAGDPESALLMYLQLGELGIEVAQSNAAYILEEEGDQLLGVNETAKRALALWSRSATQGHSYSRVKLGDYYYYGKGTDQDLDLAAEQYRMASDHMGNAQAMFNLGYMYEEGIGLQQDYHLAKRYYDLAAETNPQAAVPVNLALLKLNTKYYCDFLFEGNIYVGSINMVLGEQWDIYLIAVLCVVVAVLVRLRR